MKIGNREFTFGSHTHTMGILNVTPDSFSDGGKYQEMDQALRRVEEMVESGVDVVDVGGESTKPGYEGVTAKEEIERVLPVIKEIRKRWDVPISIDTYKAEVAKAALDAGADMVNDIWGLKYDKEMAAVVKQFGVPVCMAHNRKEANYGEFLQDLLLDLGESVRLATEAGVGGDKLILDPGVGFGKDYEQNLAILANLNSIHAFGFPVLLGASRKSVIGQTLDLPVMEREEGTLATTVVAVMAKCAFVRVHDVKTNVRAIKMAEAIRSKKRA